MPAPPSRCRARSIAICSTFDAKSIEFVGFGQNRFECTHHQPSVRLCTNDGTLAGQMAMIAVDAEYITQRSTAMSTAIERLHWHVHRRVMGQEAGWDTSMIVARWCPVSTTMTS